VLWYAARSAGLVAWGLLAASTVLGLLASTRLVPGRGGLAWAIDLHRGLAALAVAFVAVHVGAVVAHGYVPIGVVGAIVPFVSRWHPLWIAWGIVALWLLIAVEVTSLARSRLPAGLWRRVHWLSLPLFVVATVHGLAAGTDTGSVAAVGVAVVAGMAVAFLSAARLVPTGENATS
jgi:cytochrome b561